MTALRGIVRRGDVPVDVVLGLGAAACVAAAAVPQLATDGPVVCPFRLVTGLECPACGSVRAWTAALHGDFAAAAAYNPFALVLLAVLLTALGLRLLAPGALARLVGEASVRVATAAFVVAWSAWGVARMLGAA